MNLIGEDRKSILDDIHFLTILQLRIHNMYALRLSIILLFLNFSLFANKKEPSENWAVHKHNINLVVGYGTPSIIRSYLKYKTTRDQVSVYGSGPFMVKAEYMLSNKIGIGINGSYSQSRVSWNDIGYDTIQNIYRPFEFGVKAYEISATLRMNYHFIHRKKLDGYVGLAFGYGLIHMWSYTKAHTTKFSIVYDFPVPIGLECVWGLRYFPTKRFGLYTEAGIGKSWILFRKYFLPEAIIQGGLVFKL